MSTPMKCPNGCDLTGELIPGEYQDLYPPDVTNFSRVIGNYDWYEDRTISWLCPDCDIVWTRGGDDKEPPVLDNLVTKFIDNGGLAESG